MALAALAEPDPGDALERLIEAAGIVELPRFALIRNLPKTEVETLAEAGGFRCFGAGASALAVGDERLARLGDSLAAALAQVHLAQPDVLGPSRAALFSSSSVVTRTPGTPMPWASATKSISGRPIWSMSSARRPGLPAPTFAYSPSRI